jgi:hypothetical protein
MDDVQHLREQSRRCRRLAQAINDPQAIAALELMACQFERQMSEIQTDPEWTTREL